MTGLLAWLCYIAAAVIFWLMGFSVLTDGAMLFVGLALVATGLALGGVPASFPPLVRRPPPG